MSTTQLITSTHETKNLQLSVLSRRNPFILFSKTHFDYQQSVFCWYGGKQLLAVTPRSGWLAILVHDYSHNSFLCLFGRVEYEFQGSSYYYWQCANSHFSGHSVYCWKHDHLYHFLPPRAQGAGCTLLLHGLIVEYHFQHGWLVVCYQYYGSGVFDDDCWSDWGVHWFSEDDHAGMYPFRYLRWCDLLGRQQLLYHAWSVWIPSGIRSGYCLLGSHFDGY